MELGYVILAVSFLLSFGAVKILQPIARVLELVDRPGGRKQHLGVIPLIGGLAIYASVIVTVFVFIEQPLFIRLFLLAGGLIVFMGMVDDRYELSARFRLVGQFLISCIFVYALDVHFESFGDLLGIGELNPGIIGYPLAVLSFVGAINAMNMLDGMDGLVGSIVMVSFIGLVALFGANGNTTFQYLCLTFIGATGAFLIFNLWGGPKRPVKKIFMGDAGSMFLGLSLGVLLVHGSQPGVAAFTPATALWFVLLPITDMFTIMYRRLKRGRSPMAADRTHIHHILMRAGFSAKQTLYVMLVVQSLFVVIGIVLMVTGCLEALSFAFAVVFVIAYQLLLKRSWKFIRWSRRSLFAAS
ncbi:undecaprenyl/decaprenyl-phosphate alpha-N-acetylglucosaminyl 1-phosphate transferase [Teredinibacter waterburyi]|uniref:undecaprenyl/decaprenyl-phosphate alpha-N-acetylglucosaminyl 1-phosphate transferase n=1 Tax=Teredinibacter waterburyi TaxID=1500538 RepID=UPI00165F4459|nr:undecaprenyl/decaprenyl-phosphate alpha-N-acetylglucosaminyl 1-phosphate transferase [Teredinibacter waterburyi]